MRATVSCGVTCLLFLTIASNSFSQVMTDNYVQGLVPFGSYDFGTFDVVGLSNGNLHLEIPFAVFKQRGLRDQIPRYQYDTPNWVKTFYPAPMQGQTGSYVITDGLIRDGGAVEYDLLEEVICTIAGVNYSTRVHQNYTVTDLHGGVHQLALRTQTSPSCGGQTFAGPTLDASGIWVDISGGTTIKVIYPDGTTAIQDTNGNFTSFSAASGSTTTTDTLGRTWTTQAGPTATLTSPKGRTQQTPSSLTYTFNDSSGNPIPVKIDYGLWDIDTDLCGVTHAPCIEDSGTKVLPAAITIPSNSSTPLKYVFTWNGNGAYDLDLTRLDLPTGAYITYSYGTRGAAIPASSRTIVSKPVRRMITERDIFDGQNLRTWTFDTATIAGTVLNRPDGNREEHYFAKPCFGDVSYESEVRFYTAATLTKKVAKDYLCESGPSGFLGTNVRLIRETTTLDNGQVSKAEYDYETFPYSYLGQSFTAVRPNVIEKREYDFQTGTTFALLRRTTHAYLHTTGTAYKNLNIVDRVTTETIFDGAGTPLSQTVNEYDNYSHTNLPIQASGATQHGTTFGTTYTTRGNVTAVQRWRNTDGAWVTTVSQYDDAGNVIASVDPLSNKTSFDYTDSWGNASCAPTSGQSKGYLTKITEPAGNVTTKTYFSCPGLLGSITDPNLQVTSFTYDAQNRPNITTYPDGGQVDIDHDDANRWIRSRKLVTATGNPIVSYARFDQLNRVFQRQLCEDGTNACATSIMTDFTYDPIGRLQTISNPHRATTAATDGMTSYAYDVLGRQTMMIPPDGSATSNNVITAYVGNATTVTDQLGNSRKSQTDALGRIAAVWEDPNGLNFETDYLYNALDNLRTVTQKGATTDTTQWRVRGFTYNSLFQLTDSTNPESGSVSYTYDANGNVLTKTAPAPNQLGTPTVTTTYQYDSSNRLTKKSYSDGSTATVQFGYDGIALTGCVTVPPALTDSNPKGHRTSMCDASGATSWAHDKMGRVLTENRIILGTSPWTKTAGYTYFLDGSVKTISNPGIGRVMTYALDAAGRPVSVVNTGGGINFVTRATYAAFGGLSGLVNGNTSSFAGLTVSDSYDKRLQPSAIMAVSPSQTILSLAYDFGLGTTDNGNVNKIINNRDGNRTQNFLYDSLNRLQQAYTSGPNWGETFAPVATSPGVRPLTPGIDAWGNLTNRSGVTGKTNTEGLAAAPATNKNQLNGYCHDAAGNLGLNALCPVSPNPYNPVYTYDAENRLKSTAGWTYTYDGDGHRVKKVNGSSGTLYWPDLSGNPLNESSMGATNLHEYVYFSGRRVARIDVPTPLTVKYYFSDHLSSTSVITDANGSIVEESDFYPYGGEITITNNDANNYKFTGKERDAESNLDFFVARHYSGATGRFMSVDPVNITPERKVDPQQLNRYAYVRNNPTRLIDPTGEILRLSGDVAKDKEVLCDILGGEDCDRISVDAATGVVSFDTNGLNLRSNEGAAVINDLVSSQNTYDLSIGTSVDTAGGSVAVDALHNPTNLPLASDQVENRNCKCGAPTETPKQGITDQIAVNPNLVYKDSQHRTVLLPSLVFHELAEAYSKIDGGKPYSDYQIIGVGGAGTTLQVFAPQAGAHNIAVQRENQLRNERPNLQNTGRAGDSLVRDTHN